MTRYDVFNKCFSSFVRNASKTEEKIQSTDEEIKANSEAIQALEVEFKQLEIDALKVLEKSKKSQVSGNIQC